METKKQEIQLGERIGRGAENICFEMEKPEAYLPREVIKIGHLMGEWQTRAATYPHYCMGVFEMYEVPHVPTAIIKKPILLRENERIIPPIAFRSPHIEGIDDITVKHKDLLDAKIREQILDIAEKAERIYKQEGLGLDPYGGEILKDVISAIKYEIFTTFGLEAEPIEGQMRNLIIGQEDFILGGEAAKPYYLNPKNTHDIEVTKKGKVSFTDIGMHDLRPPIKDRTMIKRILVQQVTIPLSNLMWGSLMDILISEDPDIAKRDNLPFKEEGQIPRTRAIIQLSEDMDSKNPFRILFAIIKKYKTLNPIKISRELKKEGERIYPHPINEESNKDKSFKQKAKVAYRQGWRIIGMLIKRLMLPVYRKYNETAPARRANPKT